MWVPEKLQVLDLSPDFADDIKALDFLTIKDLDGDFVTSELVLPDFYFAECAHAQRLANK